MRGKAWWGGDGKKKQKISWISCFAQETKDWFTAVVQFTEILFTIGIFVLDKKWISPF